MKGFRVDVHMKSGKTLNVTATESKDFKELSLQLVTKDAILFIKDGITVPTDNIDYLEYMYEVR